MYEHEYDEYVARDRCNGMDWHVVVSYNIENISALVMLLVIRNNVDVV